jgi:peptide/nickel transport system substrate-binding protein
MLNLTPPPVSALGIRPAWPYDDELGPRDRREGNSAHGDGRQADALPGHAGDVDAVSSRAATRFASVFGSAVLVALASIAVAGCGAGHRSGTNPAASAGAARPGLRPARDGTGESLTSGRFGGTLTVYNHADFLHLDPGQTYYALDYEVVYATQTPLFFFAPNDSTRAIPLLAAGPAVISDGGRTVTVQIRHGVHFSPPVRREVVAGDVAYAIERGANPNVANPYFPSYFRYIVGADKATGGPISGIATPDRYTIVFHLVGPFGSFFVGALSMPITAPVPREFAAPLDAKKPTQYGSAVEVATGPYMLKADGRGKFLGLGYEPGKSAVLVRNPAWRRTGDARPAYLNEIDVNIGGDPSVIGRQVLVGSYAVQNDPPAGPVVKLAYQRYYRQLVTVPGAGDYYVALNNRQGPFANPNVRRAMWAALDREAMLKVSGGEIAGQVGTHFIYPGTAGYGLGGGDLGPRVDYNTYPAGNLTLAARYMRAAGYPSGRYTGADTIKVVGATGDPFAKAAAITTNALQALGFKTNFTLVDPSVMYQKYCGDPQAEIDVCPSVGWIRDWSDPQTLLDPAFAGYNIVATGNSNWGQVSWQDGPNGPHPGQATTPIDMAMKAAETTQGPSQRALAWAHVDRMLVTDAVAVPWYFVKQPMIEARDVAGVNDLWNSGTWDYSYTSLR